MHSTYRTLALFSLLGCVGLPASHAGAQDSQPELLDISELRVLAEREPPPEVVAKLNRVLNTPLISNKAAPRRPVHPPPSRPALRVAFWNIERGQQLELIRAALSDPAHFRKMAEAGQPVSERDWKRAEAELGELRAADIIILNEVDLGMKRSGYADVARELADATGMNHAFGVEFVEVDRLYTGEERIEMATPEETQALADDLRADPARYRGLHGNAILTRFPIRSARIQRLPACYDWYGKEVDGIALLEKGKRVAAQRVFEERIVRQVRRGGRMALIAELSVEGAPQGFTVVSTHLEDRTRSSCRKQQMSALTTQMREATGVVVVGGDLNTSTSDGTPTSLKYEIKKRVANPRFWIEQGIRWFSPLTIPTLVTWPINYWKNYHDPTALHIPLLGPNQARQIFQELRAFEFADGGRFDFTGGPTRSGNGRGRTLANSNERAWKGFHPTYRLQRTFGVVGTYRLDWLLVKAAPQGRGAAFFQPRYPRTLQRMNEIVRERLADHHPITMEMEYRRLRL